MASPSVFPLRHQPGQSMAHANVRFAAAEAAEWLGAPVDGPVTLAELYRARGVLDPIVSGDHEPARPGSYL
jgi:hypothetical protein